MTKREPFAHSDQFRHKVTGDFVDGISIGGVRLIMGGSREFDKLADMINSAHEARVKEAVEEFRERVANHIRSECIACQGTGQTKRGIDQRNKNVSLPVARGESKKGKK